MEDQERKVVIGAKMLSRLFLAGLVFLIVLMVSTIVAMTANFSFLDQPHGVFGAVLINLLLFGVFLSLAVGTWLVTTCNDRIESNSLINVNRLLARGFGVMVVVLNGFMLIDETLFEIAGVRMLASDSDYVIVILSEMFVVLLTPWAGFTALHYAWLYYDMKLFSRARARRFGILMILGGVAVILSLFENPRTSAGVTAIGSLPIFASLYRLAIGLLPLWAGFAAFVYVIQLPYLMKSATAKNSSVTEASKRR